MFIFYRSYKSSFGLTVLSVCANLMGILAGILGIYFFSELTLGYFLCGLLCFALAAFLIIYVGHVWTDKLADKTFDIKLRNNPNFAASIVRENPDLYESVRAVNPLFAQKFVMNENGKIVKKGLENAPLRSKHKGTGKRG